MKDNVSINISFKLNSSQKITDYDKEMIKNVIKLKLKTEICNRIETLMDDYYLGKIDIDIPDENLSIDIK